MTNLQIPLPFGPITEYATLPLIPHSGISEALAWLSRTDWLRFSIWGDAGTGKSHLLHRWAAARGATVIAGRDLTWPPPHGPLAIDDGNEATIPALLHSLNMAEENRSPVLLTGREPPSRWLVALPDLHSRLWAMHSVRLIEPKDGFRARLFRRLLDDRQLFVPSSLQAWLLIRLPRDPAALREAAARLDRAALAEQRPLTRPMAAYALADLLDDSSMPDLTGPSPGQLDLL